VTGKWSKLVKSTTAGMRAMLEMHRQLGMISDKGIVIKMGILCEKETAESVRSV
jgi:hypothetical protein